MRALLIRMLPMFLAGTAMPALAQGGAPSEPQTFPAKPVRIITGGAGSLPDIVSRRIGQRLTQMWGNSAVIDNRPGAGLTIGTAAAARATPDGYTLLVSDKTALAVAPSVHEKLTYSPSRDLAPISLIARAPAILIVHPSVPVQQLRDLIAYARKHPGKLSYAGAGPATASHVAGEMFKQLTNIDMTCVQYKGGAAGVMGVIRGEADVAFSSVPYVMPHVASGKLRTLAVTSSRRFSRLPDLPTVAEAGVPGFETDFWVGMLAPARTPAEIIARVNRDVVTVLRNPEIRASITDQGADVMEGTPDEFAAFIRSETLRMKKVVDAAGIRAD